MKVSSKMTGLEDLNRLLDSLVEPKFRAAALRSSAKQAMAPVKELLESKSPSPVKAGVVLRTKVNTQKGIKTKRVKDSDRYELFSEVTFDNDHYGMAMILEHGRSKRLAHTKDGNVFYTFGKRTKYTERDIGTTEPINFVSETRAQTEQLIQTRFSTALVDSVEKQAKRMNRVRNTTR